MTAFIRARKCKKLSARCQIWWFEFHKYGNFRLFLSFVFAKQTFNLHLDNISQWQSMKDLNLTLSTIKCQLWCKTIDLMSYFGKFCTYVSKLGGFSFINVGVFCFFWVLSLQNRPLIYIFNLQKI